MFEGRPAIARRPPEYRPELSALAQAVSVEIHPEGLSKVTAAVAEQRMRSMADLLIQLLLKPIKP
ncbi:hypothetical protein CU103_24605 [Phyllobacterium sophorae]|uniref:Uncharacterized protein n=1 Tax=Phyllobacterium sophorae TaxID=1520277 RepID=A0A2P7B3X2_9HYPH|nr:hypothetical protein CU103_24605 [Phyllobacterium sophorae]